MLFSSILFFFIGSFILYFKFKNYVPVLMYHRIADVPGDRNSLSPAKFREQMEYLTANGFTTVTMQMVYEFYAHGKTLPKKPILLTFDDGYVDNFNIALPILKEKNMTAVVFPIANWIGKENKWENFNKKLTTTMDWEQLKAWQASGMEVASHTVNHPFLDQCTTENLAIELTESKSILEKNLYDSVDFLCYPYGSFNAETKVAALKAGYKAAFAIFDHVPLWQIDLFALPRIPIPARQSLPEFKLKVSSIHIIFIVLRQWERTLKHWIRNK
jgi:peptidoglycan/xylan/chitin deacetylase (PgdA/CDA1 family)